ncbi:MAG: hypothetical protein HQ582_03060 [Planctomycetes bacterium]|nr:hypothetical protein [Planctomycetota bacterium]
MLVVWHIIVRTILTFVVVLAVFWPAAARAQYPSRFTVNEALHESGTIWEWLVLLLAFYLLGFVHLFIYCLVKFRGHRFAPEYSATCLRIARGQAKMFSVYAFGCFLMATPVLLLSSGIVIALVNAVFFEFQREGLLIGWVRAVLTAGLLGAIIFALRECVRAIKADDHFQSMRSAGSQQPTTS